MALARVRKNDTVMIIAGRERGKTGRVLRVITARERVVVERLNLQKRHQKPRGPQSPGGIVEKEGSIHVSNVMPVCGRCNKPARIGTRRLEDGSGVRICRRCNEQLDNG
jgi:large subunit ribosomal protein L24